MIPRHLLGALHATITLDCGVLGSAEATVTFAYSAPTPDTHTEPGDPEEFEVLHITLDGTHIASLFPDLDSDAILEILRAENKL